ncbi:response regulator transcription factor [Elizabethkingia ursingii]|jgi:two-component system response regulator CssR|uniref:Two-component system response regulator n=1 Tax=Elizabethkingia ursingii TaxID=1756150 RepID=A0AAJ3TQI2_9FLAO|nr:response regulator transcription factor [Elizabethkingia ursingii]MDR2231378.1 response regulator transcription factor [Flavobacteriaceae bacterium]AQX07289.1 two-component system response regulator [Elizabethkingia ursingii]MCL1665158.1 response regulator transcription factor [Elizabethkingia ursingii]OPB80305.1 two-component system response regulator [Elizabethkingia ursingii]OPB87493.1 two-component system response regulator [Elizabethkingia ursingii]
MKTKILLAEDDFDFGLILKQYLELSDFEVFWYQNPEDVMELLKGEFPFHIGILDIMMPNIDGFSLAKAILKEKTDFPLLFLTAKNQKIDRITGLKLGADDYLAKPCDPEELTLRIQNILKRTQPASTPLSAISIGAYTLHSDKLLLSHPKEEIRLTQRELDLLLFLLQHNNQTIKREIILDKLWETNDYFTGRSLDVFISRLRKYFQLDEGIKIQSLRGIGFQVDFP